MVRVSKRPAPIPPANSPAAAPAAMLVTSILADVDAGEQLVPLVDLGRPAALDERLRALIPKRGGKLPHISVWFRYASRGLNNVKLETLKAGGRLCTTASAIRRFYVRLSGLPEAATASPAAARREMAAVDARLDAAGIA